MLALKLSANRMGAYTGDGILFANALVNTSPLAGEWLRYTPDGFDRGFVSLLEDHFQPTLLLLAPLVQAFGLDLLFSFPVLAALVAVFVFQRMMLEGQVPAPLRLVVVALFLGNVFFMRAVFDGSHGFHNSALFILLLPPMVWAHQRSRWALYSLFAVLVMGVTESGAFYVAALSALSLLFGARGLAARGVNAAAVALAAGWFAFAAVGFHALTGGPGNVHVGATMTVLERIATLDRMRLVDQNWINFFGFFLPGLFAPAAYLAVLPDAIVLHLHHKEMSTWYAMPVAAMLASASAAGAGAMAAWVRRRHAAVGAALALLLGLQALLMAVMGPIYTVKAYAKTASADRSVSAETRALLRAHVPADCGVAASHSGLWLLYDRSFLLWPHQGRYARYIVSDAREPEGQAPLRAYVERHRAALEPLAATDEIQIFRQQGVPCDPRASGDWLARRRPGPAATPNSKRGQTPFLESFKKGVCPLFSSAPSSGLTSGTPRRRRNRRRRGRWRAPGGRSGCGRDARAGPGRSLRGW